MTACRTSLAWLGIGLVAALGTACAGGSDSTAGAGAPTNVVIEGNAYEPGELTVPVGTEVTWTNRASATHTVTAEDDTSFGSDELREGDSFRHRFDEAGEFAYVCQIHPFMHGTVVVG